MSLSWLLVLACKDKSPVVEDTASSEWTWSQVAWRPMAAVPGGSMDFVVMGDGDPATVLAASNNNGLFVATTDDALFTKSNDPELAPHFYAAPVLQTTPLERMVVGSSNQVLVSTDDGATFERLMTLPDLLTGLAVREGRIVVTAANRWIWTLAEQDPQIVEYVNQIPPLPPDAAAGVHGDGHVFVAIVTDDTWLVGIQGEGVYITTNQGADFSLALAAPVLHDSFAVQGQQVVVSATDQTWSSADGGLTWAPLTAAPGNCLDAAWTGSGLALACDGQLFWSQDGGQSFTDLDLNRPVVSVAHSTTHPDLLLAGSEAGLFWSTDGGSSFSWLSTDAGLQDDDMGPLAAHPTDPGVLLAGSTCQNGFYRSPNAGQTWTWLESAAHYTMGIAFAPSDPTRVYVTDSEFVARSDDGGLSLAPPADTPPDTAHFHGLAVHPTDPDTLLVGTSFEEDEFGPTDPVLLSTNDAGATWDIVGTGLPGGPISFVSIAYNPFNPADVLVCSGPGGLTHEDGEGDGLYLSKDEGVSFSRVASEHCNTFRDAAWDPHNEGVVLATCEAGILLSEDSGDTWALALPSDVPPMSFPIAWDPEHPGIVVAGADSDLLVRSLDSGQSWLDLASDLLAAGEFEAIHNLAGLAFNADGTEIWATFPLGPPWRGRPVAE